MAPPDPVTALLVISPSLASHTPERADGLHPGHPPVRAEETTATHHSPARSRSALAGTPLAVRLQLSQASTKSPEYVAVRAPPWVQTIATVGLPKGGAPGGVVHPLVLFRSLPLRGPACRPRSG